MIYIHKTEVRKSVGREQYNRMPIYEKYNYEKSTMTQIGNSPESEKEFDRFAKDHSSIKVGYTYFGYGIENGVYSRNNISYLLNDDHVIYGEAQL